MVLNMTGSEAVSQGARIGKNSGDTKRDQKMIFPSGNSGVRILEKIAFRGKDKCEYVISRATREGVEET